MKLDHLQWNIVIIVVVVAMSLTLAPPQATAGEELYLHADNIFPATDDFYTCTPPIEIEQPEMYVTEIKPKVDTKVIHHVVVYAYK